MKKTRSLGVGGRVSCVAVECCGRKGLPLLHRSGVLRPRLSAWNRGEEPRVVCVIGFALRRSACDLLFQSTHLECQRWAG